MAVEQPGITSAVQELAGELLPRTPELARGMADHLYAAIPELSAIEDEELRAELLGSTEANISQVLRLLADGAGTEDVVVPHEALEFLRGNVRRGIPLPALLRSYRLGHAWLWERWSQALQERIDDSGELAAGQDQSSAFMFAYIDKVSDVLVEEFGSERERMMRSASQLRAETVRAILAGEPVDEEVASRRLGYELGRHHLALRVASSGSEIRGLERRSTRRRPPSGRDEPLVLASGAARFDVWCGSFDPPATDALERYEPPPGVLVAFGTPSQGIAGFRSSHAEALQAARIGSLAGGTGGDELRRRRAGLPAGRRPAAGAGVRRRAARAARLDRRAGDAPARHRARLPVLRWQRDARGQGALRPPEHGRLPRQARGGAARPPGHRAPARS